MADREKLVALMREVDACICNLCVGGEGRFNHSAGILADHLLANGVVVREKGEWLPCGFGKEIMCSVCRCELEDVWEHRYCPNCGADMRKGENDNA